MWCSLFLVIAIGSFDRHFIHGQDLSDYPSDSEDEEWLSTTPILEDDALSIENDNSEDHWLPTTARLEDDSSAIPNVTSFIVNVTPSIENVTSSNENVTSPNDRHFIHGQDLSDYPSGSEDEEWLPTTPILEDALPIENNSSEDDWLPTTARLEDNSAIPNVTSLIVNVTPSIENVTSSNENVTSSNRNVTSSTKDVNKQETSTEQKIITTNKVPLVHYMHTTSSTNDVQNQSKSIQNHTKTAQNYKKNIQNKEKVKNEHAHDKHVNMGARKGCDDAKTNITNDWDNNPVNYTCSEDPKAYKPNKQIQVKFTQETIPKDYEVIHRCMRDNLSYPDAIPTFGHHRPIWPKYGEYKFVPVQRWLHSCEHGAIVMLYHPCADAKEVDKLRGLVTGCLWRHIISPYNLVTKERPLVLVTWGKRLEMSHVEPKEVVEFIKKYALKGPEHSVKDGPYKYQFLKKAEVVSDKNDTIICPNNMEYVVTENDSSTEGNLFYDSDPFFESDTTSESNKNNSSTPTNKNISSKNVTTNSTKN